MEIEGHFLSFDGGGCTVRRVGVAVTVIRCALLPARIPLSLGFDGQRSLSRDCAGNESGLQFPALSAEGALGEVGSDTCGGRFLLSAKNAEGELGSETGACPARPHLAMLLSSLAIWRFSASTDSNPSSSARKTSRLEPATASALECTCGRGRAHMMSALGDQLQNSTARKSPANFQGREE